MDGRRLGQCALAFLSIACATLQAQTRHLPPSKFLGLPAAVRADLERRRCTVPQVWYDSLPSNVIVGHFRTTSSTDWAVLCSVHDRSTILVYWAERTDSVAELAPAADGSYLQDVGNGRIGFSRVIGVVDAGYIRQHFAWYGGREPPPLDHDGINDAFAEKASVVWYWYQGKWLRLTGAD